MDPADLEQVCAIADRVHPDFPEEPQIFAERLSLMPTTCFVLKQDAAALGYCLAHPWVVGHVPALNSLLGALPEKPDCLYLHDLALLPAARGKGHAAQILRQLEAVSLAQGHGVIALVAVNGSIPFWMRHGFAVQPYESLATYGEAGAYMTRPLTLFDAAGQSVSGASDHS